MSKFIAALVFAAAASAAPSAPVKCPTNAFQTWNATSGLVTCVCNWGYEMKQAGPACSQCDSKDRFDRRTFYDPRKFPQESGVCITHNCYQGYVNGTTSERKCDEGMVWEARPVLGGAQTLKCCVTPPKPVAPPADTTCNKGWVEKGKQRCDWGMGMVDNSGCCKKCLNGYDGATGVCNPTVAAKRVMLL